MKTDLQRFIETVDPQQNGCWTWTASTFGEGRYGAFWMNGKTIGAHRASYELFFGSIPNGMYVLHRCDNPQCVCPFHLFLGTAKDNYDDARCKGRHTHGSKHWLVQDRSRARRGEATHNAKCTDEMVREIRKLHKRGLSYREISDRFPVSKPAVASIVTRRTWGHVE